MNYLESYMQRVKGRMWMHLVGHTIMDDQHISWDDTRKKHLLNERIRTHVFPFVSFSEFYNDGYRMLKDYFISLPYGRAWSFMNFLMKLWVEDRIDSIRNCYELAKDPVERAKVADMDDAAYHQYMQDYFKDNHRGIAKSRSDFLRYAKMDDRALRDKLRQVRRDLLERIARLKAELGLGTYLRYRLYSILHGGKMLFASSMFIALVAVTLAESLKMVVIRVFDWLW